MNKLELLAMEATDLDIPGAERGHVTVSLAPSGESKVTVVVHNQSAFHHCERDAEGQVRTLDAGYGPFAQLEESGDDLDAVLDRMLARVRDAVAATPAVEVA